MRSTVICIDKIKDVSDVVGISQELLQKLQDENFQLAQNTVGILFCDIDLANDEFAGLISSQLPFPVIGSSSLAILTGDGYHRDSASLMVLTADDVWFAPVISDEFDRHDFRPRIEDAYNVAKAALPEQPKTVFMLSPFVTDSHMQTDFAAILSEISGGLPIFGGVASDYLEMKGYQVMFDGKTYNDRLVLLLMAGNVRPVSTANDNISTVGRMARVDDSEGNLLKKVEGMSFVEYCNSLGMNINLNLISALSTLYVLRSKYYDEQGRSYCVNRMMQDLVKEEGWARTSAPLPVGTEISLCTVSRADITDSCSSGFNKLLEKMKENEKDGYKYSTVLTFTCMLRHIIMAHESFKEGEIIKKSIPEGINLAGFYTYGEFGPVEFAEGGADSRFLNGAIVFCAL